MHPIGGIARHALSTLAPESVWSGLAAAGIIAGAYTWVETTGATIGIIVAIVSGLGYIYRTLIRPTIHVLRDLHDNLDAIPEMRRDIATLKNALTPKESDNGS